MAIQIQHLICKMNKRVWSLLEASYTWHLQTELKKHCFWQKPPTTWGILEPLLSYSGKCLLCFQSSPSLSFPSHVLEAEVLSVIDIHSLLGEGHLRLHLWNIGYENIAYEILDIQYEILDIVIFWDTDLRLISHWSMHLGVITHFLMGLKGNFCIVKILLWQLRACTHAGMTKLAECVSTSILLGC